MERYYPTSVLVTGFDIIFFWVARMMMMGLKFAGDVPFREIYIHGLVRDQEGQKMSKSKGNVLDPLDIIDGIDVESLVAKRTTGLMQPKQKSRIEKLTRAEFPQGIPAFGTDALRFTFASLATTGRDIRFDLGRVEGYRNFCNKLWNASRYVLMNTEAHADELAAAGTPGLADRWIRSRFRHALDRVHESFGLYRLDLAAQAIYEFVWHEFCDWYLELAKPTLQTGDAATRAATRQTLVEVLEATLRMMHPLMPFITEEIWGRVAPLAGIDGETVMLADYPNSADWVADSEAEREIGWLQRFVLGVRQIRGEMNIAPGRPLPVLMQEASASDVELLGRHRAYLTALANLESVEVLDGTRKPPPAAAALLGTTRLLVPMAGVIDVDQELARLGKQIGKLQTDLGKTRAKLDNPRFVENAPADVVEKERRRAADMTASVERLEAQAEQIRALADS